MAESANRRQLNSIVNFVESNLASLSDNSKSMFRDFLASVMQRERGTPTAPPPPPPEPTPTQIPDAARLLWVAAGGNPEVFIRFIQTYPDPELAGLAQNTARLVEIIRTLTQEIPKGQPGQDQGITQSWLPSSNVWGFRYDKNNNQMFVKFNGKNNRADGPTYVYQNVPPEIARIVASGSISAKTKGRNRWGRWWEGKNPSIAASVNQLLVKGGFPYQKIS